MRVAISPDIFGHQRFGGISRYFSELHLSLRTCGIDAQIFAGCHSNALLGDRSNCIGVRHRGIRTPRWLRGTNEVAFRSWCAAVGEGLVVHRTYYDWRTRPRCSRLVTTIHDLIPEMLEPDGDSTTASRRKRAACAESDAVCVNSRTTASDLHRLWGVPKARIWVTPLGVRRIEPSAGDCTRRFGGFFLFVGSRGGYKNAAALFRALARATLSPKVSLVCFGGGPPSHSELVQLDGLGIRGRVHFMSGDDSQLAACYRDAMGYVCPSLYEGFGLPVLEAMSHGCPVACARAGALPEVAVDAALYFEPRSESDIALALERLSDDRAAVESLVSRGLERVRAFTWEETARRTVMAYAGQRPQGDAE